ncbi:major facilitator superfamily domain-containing protein [Dioszegia hungarica]|uniref:Major facilitator superfamily domain-containing protein n=1 Tax=Dioszegia hungarica TaxID=4972 RepID=A0AA38HEU4_9TREE|nr:major facilitator superfamily domain-containing protein [Dioszegia hungarica]KAI9638179.1 major facilitator superfamily domain-containing protein [Dioszegia hungarica]
MSKRVAMSEKPDMVHENHMDGESLQPTGTRMTDGDKGSSRYADSESGFAHKSELAKAERKLIMKLDLGILPFAVLLYLSAYLDRGNLANARLQGLQEQTLNNSDTNYSIALVCFFITYIVFSIPGTLLAKQYNPSTTIAIGCLIWSVAATCQAAAMNPAGVFVCRLFVGIGEAMFGQAMAFHLSLWYTKRDLAKRVGLFISAGALAGAFGGLISFGVSSIQRSSIAQWRILFLIEGCPSVLLGIVAFFFMPGRPETSRYLTEDQRTLCLTRLNRSAGVSSELGIDWKGVKRCATDWKSYVIAIMYSCMNLTLASVGGFLPTIIKGFGYSNAQAQLFTVPPYAVALVFMLLLTSFSDYKQSRGIPIMSVFLIGIVGWAILLSVPAANISQSQYSARYFACCCIVTAGYTNIPLIISWQAGNNPNESQRATALGYLNSIGQSLSLAASFLFPSVEGPSYTKGSIVNIAFQAFGLLIALSMTLYYRFENKRRDEAEGGRPPAGTHLDTHEFYDKAQGFRYVI